jgi:hypothetical protein
MFNKHKMLSEGFHFHRLNSPVGRDTSTENFLSFFWVGGRKKLGLFKT